MVVGWAEGTLGLSFCPPWLDNGALVPMTGMELPISLSSHLVAWRPYLWLDKKKEEEKLTFSSSPRELLPALWWDPLLSFF